MENARTEITLGHMFAIAAPMVVSQASETLMLFFNRWVVSFLGADHIPASMSGGLTSFVFTSFFTGITGYVNALVAQYHGAQREERCVQVASQGFWLTLGFYPLLLLLIPAGHRLFIWAGHSPRQLSLEFSYYRILMLGSFIFMIQSVLVGYFVGLGKTRVVMTANLLGILVNLPLNWCLVFGKMGFPRLGIQGAALGTLGGSLFIVSILLVSYLRSSGYRQRTRKTSTWVPRGDLLRKLLRYGLPAGAETFINVFAFNVFVMLMQSYSEQVATAITITFNYDLVSFIPMLGVGAATTALVGHRMGAGDPAGARKVAFLGLRLGWGYAALMGIVFVAGAPVLVQFFAGGFTTQDQSILPIAQTLLRMAALYTMADAANVVFSGALRGAGDTRWVMVVSGILHWVMASGAYLFIKILVLPPVLVWLFFIVFVFSLGLSMFLRHRRGKWMSIRMVESQVVGAM
ncbi:MAG: MATE family efflux transporter [Spirochaetia bacterium]|jgi:MATE family multidrug resistance protein